MAKRPVSDSDSSSSSSEEEVQTKKVVTKKPVESDSSDSDSSSEEEVKKPAPKAKAAPAKKVESDSDSDSSDESSSEDEKPAPKAKAAAKKAESSDSESDSDSESEESEEEKPVMKRKRDDDDAPISKKQKDIDGGANTSDSTTIFVGGLPYDKTEKDIRAFFAKCGEIESVRIPTFPDSGRPRGLAFITFVDASSVKSALAYNEKDFGGRYIIVKESDGRAPGGKKEAEKKEFKPFQVSEKPEGCKTVFVGGLSFSATEDDLRATFDSCGTIVNARIAWDRDQDRSKGFGYVDFEEDDAVESAVKLTGTTVAGRSIRVDYSAPRQNNGERPERSGFGGGRGGSRGRGAPRGGSRGGFGGRGGRGGFGSFGGQNKKMTFD